MDLMNLLKSVEELLYEIVSWLLFYPLTLWKCVRHPIRMMAYAEAELASDAKTRYAAAVSPPIFLFLTLVIAHLVDLRFGLPTRELTGAMADQRNLLLFRAVLFSLFPLMMAVQRVRKLGQLLTRETLRPAFYSQCYAAAPFALSFDLAMTSVRYATPTALILTAVSLGAGLLWYIAVETRWLALHAGVGHGTALLRVLATLLVGALFFVLVALAMASFVAPA
ncbi:MAG: MFS transporter permease [Fulvimarina sp.]|nr:MFS transporter permease [Fulvimarina sp.]